MKNTILTHFGFRQCCWSQYYAIQIGFKRAQLYLWQIGKSPNRHTPDTTGNPTDAECDKYAKCFPSSTRRAAIFAE
jgi:hypothetical protein